MIETVIINAIASGLEAIVVAGFRGGELHSLLDGRPGIHVVDNPGWEEGMLGSILRGAGTVRGEGFFVLPADMPLVGVSVFKAMLAACGDGDETLFAACEGRLGHPVCIPISYLSDLRGLGPEARLRDFLLARDHRLVETGDSSVLRDLDTQDEYLGALKTRGY